MQMKLIFHLFLRASQLEKKRAALTVAAIAWDSWPATPPGLCLLPPDGRVEATIRQTLPTGPAAPARLLGLPIWPGDSHQSSVYELLDRKSVV